MDKSETEKREQNENRRDSNKITSVDFYTVSFTILQLYLMKLSLASFISYLGSYLSGKFLVSHIIAFLSGLNIFLLLVNLIGISLIVKSDNYQERKNMVVNIFNTSIFIIFIYTVIELLNARMPY